jgi:hypothetical protein
MNKLLFAFVGVLTAFSTLLGQYTSTFKTKYTVITSYEVRPGILMTPTFAPDGRVCRMVLEKMRTRVTDKKVSIDTESYLSKAEVQELLAELVPVSERGKQLTDFENWLGSVTLTGSYIVTRYLYQNVAIEVDGIAQESGSSSDIVVIIEWRDRQCSSK